MLAGVFDWTFTSGGVVHCNYHSGNGIFSIHWRVGWWDFPQWEVMATQYGENGFTVITTVGMESFPFTGEWVIQKTQLRLNNGFG